MKTYWSNGKIKYNKNWVILQISQSIPNYYKFWVEKFTGRKISTSYHGGHVSIIAGKYEDCTKHSLWNKYDGRVIPFEYESKIYTDNNCFILGKYYWLRINCPLLSQIRREFGLKPTPFHPFHITIGYKE